MQPDPEYLREHYALLSDDALLEIDRADLVETAQNFYDHEIARRRLGSTDDAGDSDEPAVPYEQPSPGDRPDWLEDASVAISYTSHSGGTEPAAAADAFDALRVAGIPCYLDFCEVPPEEVPPPAPTYEWRVMVPGKFNFRADSVLKRSSTLSLKLVGRRIWKRCRMRSWPK